jgi:hypothetical protein
MSPWRSPTAARSALLARREGETRSPIATGARYRTQVDEERPSQRPRPLGADVRQERGKVFKELYKEQFAASTSTWRSRYGRIWKRKADSPPP